MWKVAICASQEVDFLNHSYCSAMENHRENVASSRQMKLAAFIYQSDTSQAWRHPTVSEQQMFDVNKYIEYARVAEDAKFDALFLADTGAPPRLKDETMSRLSSLSIFEPLTLMCALATHTRNVGLVYTASATYTEPYNIARQVASLDHLSGGRAGWNLVTAYSPTQAANFGGVVVPEHAQRYARAEEFYEVVSGLWDSFEDDAFIRDKATGRFVDPAKLHYLDHKGTYYSVEGPLRIARPVQGHPVIAQAGASEEGRALGARIGNLIFCTNLALEDGQSFYADMKRRAVGFGRSPDDIKIMTGVGIIWGETDEEAQRKFDEISRLYPTDVAIQNFGFDLSQYDPDEKFPLDLPLSRGSQGHQRAITDFAVRHDLTIRQTAQRLAATSKHRVVLGSATTIADQLEEWFLNDACDGFVILSPFLLEGFKDIARYVVPELQRRGLFRKEYEGKTLRENLGVGRPAHRLATRRRTNPASHGI
jgi:FMN-dependent oxidoreductase (nitrilotriacetate monooxygenase family)